MSVQQKLNFLRYLADNLQSTAGLQEIIDRYPDEWQSFMSTLHADSFSLKRSVPDDSFTQRKARIIQRAVTPPPAQQPQDLQPVTDWKSCVDAVPNAVERNSMRCSLFLKHYPRVKYNPHPAKTVSAWQPGEFAQLIGRVGQGINPRQVALELERSERQIVIKLAGLVGCMIEDGLSEGEIIEEFKLKNADAVEILKSFENDCY